MFLPDSFVDERDSVLALLRFKRVGFKTGLVLGLVKERLAGLQQPQPAGGAGAGADGHETQQLAACEMCDQLTWVAAMCTRFADWLGACGVSAFSRAQGALHELEPVERALNGWIDGLRRDELDEARCVAELQRTMALLAHLAELHLPSGDLAVLAGNVRMRMLMMQSHMETTAAAATLVKLAAHKVLLPTASTGDPTNDGGSGGSGGGGDISNGGGGNTSNTSNTSNISSDGGGSGGIEDEAAAGFTRQADGVISQARNLKVVVGKILRAVDEFGARNLAIAPPNRAQFEECESAAQKLASYTRALGYAVFALLFGSQSGSQRGPGDEDEPVREPSWAGLQQAMFAATERERTMSESDVFGCAAKDLKQLAHALADLAAVATDIDSTAECPFSPVFPCSVLSG